MLLNFKEWLVLHENMWGNIPVKGRKPSDGPPGVKPATGMPDANTSQPMNAKMKKKMKND